MDTPIKGWIQIPEYNTIVNLNQVHTVALKGSKGWDDATGKPQQTHVTKRNWWGHTRTVTHQTHADARPPQLIVCIAADPRHDWKFDYANLADAQAAYDQVVAQIAQGHTGHTQSDQP
jgi:hypothetical protein